MATQKIIHYKIMLSTVFPAGHPRKGQRTWFVEQINDALIPVSDEPIMGQKIHTIRNNYPLWVKRMEKVHAGKAVIDLCYWKLPGGRFTPGNEAIPFATLDKDSGCGVQRFDNITDTDALIHSVIGLNRLKDCVALNDGLSVDDFKAWFKGYDLSKSMAIIQFTKFRY